MSICPNCGKNTPEGKFCEFCGASLQANPIPLTTPAQPHIKESKRAYYIGIVSLIAWLLPLLGFPVSIIGLYLGYKDIKKSENLSVRRGILFSQIGLILTIINAILGAIMKLY